MENELRNITKSFFNVTANDNILLKDGRVTDAVNPGGEDEFKLPSMMVEREIGLKVNKPRKVFCKPVFEVDNLWVRGNDNMYKVKGAGCDVRGGEILGIAGIANNGQKELVEALFGLRAIEKGIIRYKGINITGKTPRQKRNLGIGYIPQDRIGIGSNIKGTIWENAIIGYHLNHLSKNKLFIDHNIAYAHTKGVVEQFKVKIPSIFSAAETLSGGNLQKLIVGREFAQDYNFFIIEDPTKGIDIGSTEFIWQQLVDSASAGKTILLISHDLNEILSLSDRIAVIHEGRIIDILDASSADENKIGLLMTGGNSKCSRKPKSN